MQRLCGDAREKHPLGVLLSLVVEEEGGCEEKGVEKRRGWRREGGEREGVEEGAVQGGEGSNACIHRCGWDEGKAPTCPHGHGVRMSGSGSPGGGVSSLCTDCSLQQCHALHLMHR